MNPEIIITLVVVLVIFTASYKFLPYRSIGERKPVVAFLPKYKKEIETRKTDAEIENQLKEYGFSKVGSSNGISIYARGSVLGDFSIKLAKVNIKINRASDSTVIVHIEASWFVAFDTGDFWQFLTELTEKIQNA
ncbi:hypothetical protein P3383_23620 [Vibrio parahaemolyticus]|uniref:hypothetical protein n=1 Tax=Vibrio parahaemolyticus TaxID=670 RepID=UPI00111E2727|nr:hypothetical protein [Vibrio parahaemolyticus]EHR5764780.1 hypothetical protein [Vibrio parahaemolyticus]EHY0932433.1 hypothetical protein [Vibrio parahaemolyticus]EJC6832017.1 hypothetical protein [Vibrio parahaemolyticus]ELA9596034.1 hypothetical protein [Vibrio parahaemolyticus]MDF4336167.1 hypothetical protein [Vibrio parahaemolyticus]